MNLKIIEDWISNNDFSRICEQAERGNRECALFINKFINELNSLYFHLHNRSHDKKIKSQVSKWRISYTTSGHQAKSVVLE